MTSLADPAGSTSRGSRWDMRHDGGKVSIRTCLQLLSEETPYPYPREGGRRGAEDTVGGARLLVLYPVELFAVPIQSVPPLQPILLPQVLADGLRSRGQADESGLDGLGG